MAPASVSSDGERGATHGPVDGRCLVAERRTSGIRLFGIRLSVQELALVLLVVLLAGVLCVAMIQWLERST